MIAKLLFACLFLYPVSISAQNKSVSGKVTDKADGQPMTGVNVVVKGTTKGASTDIDGNYSIDLAPR